MQRLFGNKTHALVYQGWRISQCDVCSCLIICESLKRLLIINPLNHWKVCASCAFRHFKGLPPSWTWQYIHLVLVYLQVIITLNCLLCVVIPHLKAIRMLPVFQNSRGSSSENLPLKCIVISFCLPTQHELLKDN